MAKKQKPLSSIVLIILGLAFIGISFISICGSCAGWDVINPLCQLSNFACIAQWTPVAWVLRIAGIGAILVGIVRMIRG